MKQHRWYVESTPERKRMEWQECREDQTGEVCRIVCYGTGGWGSQHPRRGDKFVVEHRTIEP